MKVTLEEGQTIAVDFPTAFHDKHTAILGTTGAGKTSVAKAAIVEPLLRQGSRVHIIDPKTDWWGLRLNRKGKAFGSKVIILGGERGDYLLRVREVTAITEALATSSNSVIFDTKGMTVEERMQFFIAYAETILRKNRGPLNIIIDEAHIFLPQAGAKIAGLAPRMLHAGNELLSSGRSQGLRIALLTQRPQKLHKDSLTLVQSLIAMRMFHPRDRGAVEEWMAEVADPVKGKAIMESLHELKPGEGWAWSPVDKYMERIQFPKPLTFDSSKAPEAGDPDIPFLPEVDIGALTGKLAALAQEKADNDPAKLRARIAELERQKAYLPEVKPMIDLAAVAKAHKDGFDMGFDAGYRRGQELGIGQAQEYIDTMVAAVSDIPVPAIHEIRRAQQKHLEDAGGLKYDPPIPGGSPRGGDGKINRPHPPARTPMKQAIPVSKPPSTVSDGGTLSASEMKIATALRFYRSIGEDQPTKEQVAFVAGYNPTGGRFGNLLGAMRSAGIIDYPSAGRIALIQDVGDDMTMDEASRTMLSVLSASEQKVITAIDPASNPVITRVELAARSEYDPKGGRFGNIVGRLCTLGILEKKGPGEVALAPWAAELLQ